MKQICNRLESALKWTLVALVATLTLTVFWQVLTRFTGRPSTWTEELAKFGLGWVGVLGIVYAFRRREHLGFDLFYNSLSDAGKKRLELLGFALAGGFSVVVLLYGGLKLVILTVELHQTTPVMGLPMGAIYSVLPISGLLLGLFALDFFLQRLSREESP